MIDSSTTLRLSIDASGLTWPACCDWSPPQIWLANPQTPSVSDLVLGVCLGLHLPLLPQQLLDSTLERIPEVLQGVIILLLLLLVPIVFLMTLGVMDVVVKGSMLLLVLVVAAPESK